MEQVIVVQQSQADLLAIIEQVRNMSASFVVMEKDKPAVKITLAEPSEKPVTMHKRNAGFLKNKVNNTPAPRDFDRMNEDEIFQLFVN